MLPISVCIIAKNEEAHIEECCKHLAGHFAQIVVADSGSTDATVEIARRFSADVFSFTWQDDFAAARNIAVSHATQDWILSIDCDEYLEEIDEQTLQNLMNEHPKDAGRILLRNRLRNQGDVTYERVFLTRLFPKKYYHFTGTVHEQIEPIADICEKTSSGEATANTCSQESLKASIANVDRTEKAIVKTVFDAPIQVLHVGYDLSEDVMQQKARRNLALLSKELEKNGPDAYVYYQLGASCMRLKDYAQAEEWFGKGLALDVDPALDYVQSMVESYGYSLMEQEKYAEALSLYGVYDTFSKRADFVFLMGLICMENGKFAEAIEEFKKAAATPDYAREGVNGYLSFYNIGVICECTGDLANARHYYEACGDFAPAKNRLDAMGE